jgi:hypothetical protein
MPSCTIVSNPTYLPKRSIIASITQAEFPTVTTTADHQLTTNQYVRFFIPENHGMQQIHNQVAIIAITSPTTFLIDINTTTFDALVVPLPGDDTQCSQVVPIAENASTLEGSERNVLGP